MPRLSDCDVTRKRRVPRAGTRPAPDHNHDDDDLVPAHTDRFAFAPTYTIMSDHRSPRVNKARMADFKGQTVRLIAKIVNVRSHRQLLNRTSRAER